MRLLNVSAHLGYARNVPIFGKVYWVGIFEQYFFKKRWICFMLKTSLITFAPFCMTSCLESVSPPYPWLHNAFFNTFQSHNLEQIANNVGGYLCRDYCRGAILHNAYFVLLFFNMSSQKCQQNVSKVDFQVLCSWLLCFCYFLFCLFLEYLVIAAECSLH